MDEIETEIIFVYPNGDWHWDTWIYNHINEPEAIEIPVHMSPREIDLLVKVLGYG